MTNNRFSALLGGTNCESNRQIKSSYNSERNYDRRDIRDGRDRIDRIDRRDRRDGRDGRHRYSIKPTILSDNKYSFNTEDFLR